ALRAEGVDAQIADLSSREALTEAVKAAPPDLVLLDLDLGGEIGDGSTLVRPFSLAGARVLLVSATRRRSQVGAAIEQGAVGHVPKTVPFEDLLATVLAAARGESVMSAEERHAFLQELYGQREREAAAQVPFERLTSREQQVLRELGNGKAVGAIAEEWFVSEATVRTQVRGVLTKLGVGSQLEAVALAVRVGWLTDGRRGRPTP
ncbi:MAG: response regulator transcription factor, partial [Nocardioides sp.]